jgi:phosphate transport system substrate-binding protein
MQDRSKLAMSSRCPVYLFRVLLSFLLLSSTLVAAPQQDPTEPTLSWRGCGITKKAFMERCATVYSEKTGVNIRLTGGGATLGIEAAGQGGADFGGTCRACLSSRNEDKMPLALTVVAWDALVVVVHPDNPLDSITPEQLKAVLQQEITDWGELGGKPGRIITIARKGKISGVGFMTRKLIFGDAEADYGKRVIRLQSSGPVEELLEESVNGIAVTGISSAKLRKLKVLKVGGVEPTMANIATGKYPYYRPLYLAHPKKMVAEQQRFLNWLLGGEGQQVVHDQGTVNLSHGYLLALKYRHWEDNVDVTNKDALIQKAKLRVPVREKLKNLNGPSK